MQDRGTRLRLGARPLRAAEATARRAAQRAVLRGPHPRGSHQSQPADLTQPEIILPEQFFGVPRRHPTSVGQLRLVGAVLEDAVHCFQKYAQPSTARQRRLFRDAEQWIMGSDAGQLGNQDPPRFSFEYICSVLDLDPGYVRSGLQRWRRQQLASASAATPFRVSPAAPHVVAASRPHQ